MSSLTVLRHVTQGHPSGVVQLIV